MRPRSIRLLLMAAASVGLMLVPGVGLAQYAPTGDDFVTCTPTPASPGSTVECAAGLFDPGTDVGVLVEASVLLDTTVTADQDGEIMFSFDIPADHPQGTYEVTLTGVNNGEVHVVAASSPIAATQAEGAADQGLGQTGSNTIPMVIVALLALGIGGGALYATRGRTRAGASA